MAAADRNDALELFLRENASRRIVGAAEQEKRAFRVGCAALKVLKVDFKASFDEL